MARKFIAVLLFFCFFSTAKAQFYSGSQQEFGKNRVQYGLPNYWTLYKFDKYNVYFYKGGREIGEFVAVTARKHQEEIEKLLDFQLESKIEFMVYNKQSEFRQSNLGLQNDEQYNIGGVTRIVGSKVAMYFDGDHKKLEQQVRAGIAEVVINQMMYGGNVKDMLKNSTFLTLPDWYTQGLISFLSNRYDAEVDNRVKDGILSGKYNKFNHLTGQDAVAAGHSLWAYVAETYGDNVISNILYMTKLSRNVENAFLFVLGVSVKNVSVDWVNYYQTRYVETDKSRTLPSNPQLLKKPKASRVYSQFKMSPDGKYCSYVTNEMGQYKVWLYDMEKKKAKRIMKREHKLDRIVDYSFPLLTWHPTSEILTMITENKGELLMTYYTVKKGKKDIVKMVNFEKILDLAYSPDGRKIAISGVNKGQSDIYVYSIAGGAIDQVTNDIYDDFNPRFLNNGKKIIFSSNRVNDTIGKLHKGKDNVMYYKDLFIYNYENKNPVLKRVTFTPLVNEIQPYEYDSTSITYLADENGIRNRYVATFDSVLAFVDTSEHYRYITRTMAVTNYSRSIQEHNILHNGKTITQIVFYNGAYHLHIEEKIPFTALKPLELKSTYYSEMLLKYESVYNDFDPGNNVNVKIVAPDKKTKSVKKDSTLIDIDNYVFDSERLKQPKKEKKTEKLKDLNSVVKAPSDSLKNQPLVFGRMWNYNVFFMTDYVVSQIDNTFLNSNYQKFTGGTSPIYLNPGFTGFFKIGMSDLFEDYQIVGGARLSGNLNSNEFFMSWENRLKRWDKAVILHRQALLDINNGFYLVKVHTHQAKYALKYPFSEVAAFRVTFTARHDRTVYLALEESSLKKPHEYEYWAGVKLEYIFDNTIKRGLNLYNGWRMKFFGELFSQVDKAETDLAVVGLDIRHYQKIHREFIWANRLSASTSFGHQKLIYYMGGVDNWFSPKFNRQIPVAQDENYVYQTLATPMRGFWQNTRNGNNFVLFNSELRMPLFRYLLNKPIRSDFINNFQVIAFGDIGTAWNGPDPFSDKNALNTLYVGAPGHPILVVLHNQREPIVGGYGFGLRSRLLGYFIRADWSWGIDDGVVLPRQFYLSFSLDF